MNAYLWLKLVHVVSAIVAVGTNATYFFWLRQTTGGAAGDAFVLEGIRALDRRMATPAYVVLPITGIAMVVIEDLGFSTLWISTAIGLYIALAAVAGIFFAPALRRQAALAQQGDADSSAYASAARRTALTGAATMALSAVILYLMVIKPA